VLAYLTHDKGGFEGLGIREERNVGRGREREGGETYCLGPAGLGCGSCCSGSRPSRRRSG